jgi:hypothetical protein
MGELHVFSEKLANMVFVCGDQAEFSVAKMLDVHVHGGSGGAFS